MPVVPPVEENPCTCETCGHVFQSYLYRAVGVVNRSLVDRDGNIVFDLVVVCKYCSTVFHWHTKEKSMQEMSKNYQSMFELLETLHSPGIERPSESAIIQKTNETG